MNGQAATRRRDAAATRSALLAAAGELFAERGFDHTTVREIAARAGVNQALLFRYFGSKQELFGMVLAERGRELLAAGPAETLVARVLAAMADAEPSAPGGDPLYIAMLSPVNAEARQALRDHLSGEYGRALASLTSGPDAEVRAQLVLAWLLGITLLRSTADPDPLRQADPEAVTGYVLTAVATILERVNR